jgi:hypothetical protein
MGRACSRSYGASASIPGQGWGERCHADIEKAWYRQEGQQLVIRWGKLSGFFECKGLIVDGG